MLVGVDVVSVERIATVVERNPRFIARVYTPRERADCSGRPQRLASTWAAKEAVRKLHAAAAETIPAFSRIEVVRSAGRPPRLRVHGADIRISLSLSHDAGIAAAVVAFENAEDLAPLHLAEVVRLPDRPDDGHKGTFGRVLVIAGSRGFTGAPVLAGLGAARGGAGLVTLCVPEAIYSIVATRCLEVMPLPLPDAGSGALRPEMLEALEDPIAKADSVVIGPGVGRALETGDAIVTLVGSLPCPAVVDADALNIVAEREVAWRRGGSPIVITPHPAEMGRLARLETAVVQSDRERVATSYAREHGVTVVLKGSGTIVASPDGRTFVDSHRVVALATGGTGDVLAGLLGALIAQGLDLFDAAVAAVTIHAEAGLRVQALRGRAGALASDVIEALPAAQERIRRALERARAQP
jgi:hydroxyethylthiazole kinase-like uncharacterized protein yjeF